MNITSIDNAYEDDGIANLTSLLTRLNIDFQQSPDDPQRSRLIAIIPEYDAAGRLDRLDVITVPASDPSAVGQSGPAAELYCAACQIVEDERRKRAEAEANLSEPIVVLMPETPK